MASLFFLKCKDEFRYSAWSRELWGSAFAMAARVARGPRRIALLSRAIGLCERKSAWRKHINYLHAQNVGSDTWWKVVNLDPRLSETINNDPALSRSAILKSFSDEGEKGVILVSYEYNLLRILSLPREELAWLAGRFEIILAASSTPTHYPILGLAASLLPGGFWVQPANHGERDRIAAFHPRIRPLSTLACDWVDPDFYQPRPWEERSIDILMVAYWGHVKRHWEFFEAARKLPASLRITLVGRPDEGRTLETIRDMSAQMGVPQELDIRQSLPNEDVTRLQCDARVALIMSRREGGCLSMVEALHAGCAIAMREGATIGSAAYVNEHTGAFLRPGKIAEDLTDLLQRGSELTPDKWARENISCERTLNLTEIELRRAEEEAGRPWTRSLAQAHARSHPILKREEDRLRLAPVYRELHQRFPHLFPPDLLTNSSR